MSHDAVTPRQVQHADGHHAPDPIAVEAPLEIRVEDHSIGIVMRSPGHDLELAAGLLHTEGILEDRHDLAALDHLAGDAERNTVVARLASGVEAHLEAIARATRERFASSGCGICGKTSVEHLTAAGPPIRTVHPDPQVLASLPQALEAAQHAFRQTGGVHGAALVAPDGQLLVVREDIGRHNAVDKVLGWSLLRDGPPEPDRFLLVSSRAGFEIVQKASAAGIGAVVAVGAASSLAIDLAAARGITLIGFLRADRYTRYT